MSQRAKYIIIDDIFPLPVIFNEYMTHSDVARALAFGKPIIGAGFCYIDDNGHYSCYGESTSLKVKSNGEADSKLLNKNLGVIGEDE